MWKASACRWWKPCSENCPSWPVISRSSERLAAMPWRISSCPTRPTWRGWSAIMKAAAPFRSRETCPNGSGWPGRNQRDNLFPECRSTSTSWPEVQVRIALDVSILQAPRTGIGEYPLQLGLALRQLRELDLHLFDGLGWRRDFPAAARPGYSTLRKIIRSALPGAYRIRRKVMQRRFDNGAGLVQ